MHTLVPPSVLPVMHRSLCTPVCTIPYQKIPLAVRTYRDVRGQHVERHVSARTRALNACRRSRSSAVLACRAAIESRCSYLYRTLPRHEQYRSTSWHFERFDPCM